MAARTRQGFEFIGKDSWRAISIGRHVRIDEDGAPCGLVCASLELAGALRVANTAMAASAFLIRRATALCLEAAFL